ncbi:MAG: DUF3604 domain-containing protein [Candidatus Lokiarchaeota archaeon]|nr:DUF3604 domain-containing protein [Candidatus Lokiarchaeota archaeon]
MDSDKEQIKADISGFDSHLGKRGILIARGARSLVYLISIYSIVLFWWSWTGILIGCIFFFLSKDPAWKLNGLILSITAGLTTFFVETIGVLWLIFGILVMFIYLFIIIGYHLGNRIYFKRKNKHIEVTKFIKKRYDQYTHKKRSIIKIGIKVAIIALLLVLWSIVNINFMVMFDNNPRLLWVHTPTNINRTQEFSITVEAWDAYERVSANYQGYVEFAIRSYNLTTLTEILSPNVNLPGAYTFTGQLISQGFIPGYIIFDGRDNGIHEFTVRINTTGIHYLLVNDSVTGNTYWSNPIIVDNFTSSESKIYWGDIHCHTSFSDGSGNAEHSYFYAQKVACLDYVSLTDHGEQLSTYGFNYIPYELVETATNRFYSPNIFVTLHGVEWTTNYPPSLFTNFGHYTCIVSGDHVPIIASNIQLTPNDLWSALDSYTASGEGALAIPHHTIRESFIQDWTYTNPKYVKLAEVTSVHGECLYDGHDPRNYRGSVDIPNEIVPGSSIIDAFKMGLNMSLCANGDNHDGHPGHSLSHTDAYIGHQWPFSIYHARNGHPYSNGLTAVRATSLTRDGIFTGLQNERIYACSDYGRPYLNFSINGVFVGDGSSVTIATNTTQRNISIFLAQDGAASPVKGTSASVCPGWQPEWKATIEVIKNGEIWNKTQIDTPVFQLNLNDTEMINGTSYDTFYYKNGYYYINRFSENPVDPDTLNTGGRDFYLIRISGFNHRTVYAGPIWVESLN